jgi:aminopeptidase N
MRKALLWLTLVVVVVPVPAQQLFTRADTLRGDWTTPGRAWWDVTWYDLDVTVSPGDSTISGHTTIVYRVLAPGLEMQIDLMPPLSLDSVTIGGIALPLRHEGAAHFATLAAPPQVGSVQRATAWFSGRPRVAPRPPWDGGVSWQADSLGRPWVVTTDQGVGASVWWPNKDTQADETDSMQVTVRVPRGLTHVGNGRARVVADEGGPTVAWRWAATSPINNYAIALNIANYAHWSEVYRGEAGELTMDYYPLDFHERVAQVQWVQARPMMQCFEHWFGPYPWYADGYKVVEVPYPGMEHQSAVTYGNGFANGYRGRDGSGTGLGMRWDFIIVHESAHEWWGNNLSTPDLADMWVHESFANYAENLYTECLYGKEAGERYVVGTRRGIRNDRPVIPAFGVNAQGSGDMYPKGGNMLHTIRRIIDDDTRWREILRGLQHDFRHQVVTGQQVRDHISREAGVDLSKVFEQYLTTTDVPVLRFEHDAGPVPDSASVGAPVSRYSWENVVDGFEMPVDVYLDDGSLVRLHPTTNPQRFPVAGQAAVKVDAGFYVTQRDVVLVP